MKKLLLFVPILIVTQLAHARITSIPGGGGGVSQITAGTNVTISPSNGSGNVTINASGGGGGGGASSLSLFTNNNVDTGVRASTLGVIVSNGLGFSYSGTSGTLSIPTTAQMTIQSIIADTATFKGTVTSTTGFIGGGSTFTAVNVAGAAGSIQGTNGLITLVGDFAFQTTWYTGVAFPFDAGSSSRIVTGSLYGQNGRFLGDGQQSSGTAVCGYFQKWVSKYYIAGTTPTLTDIVELSTGLVSQQTSWIIDFATQSVVAVSTGLTYSAQVIVPITGTTIGSGGIRSASPEVPLTGLWSILGNGRKFLIVRARRNGDNTTTDPAQSDTAIAEIAFDIRVQK